MSNFVAIIFAILIYVVLPLFLAFTEYRMAKNNKKYGLYLIVGVLASGLLFGLFSLFVSVLLIVVYLWAIH